MAEEKMDAIDRCGFGVRDGWLYCDDVKVSDLHRQLAASDLCPTSPAFVYSRRRLVHNVRQYQEALRALHVPGTLFYSMKANYNLEILNLLRSLGCGLTLVSGGELQIALAAGFEASRLLLNGSGKVRWEVEAAVRADVLLNVDSEWDLQQTVAVCRTLGRPARALLRLNLDIDPKVHKYVSTGQAGSKFGLDPSALARVTSVLIGQDCPVRVEGLHCHLGSTIQNADILRESVQRMLAVRQELSQGLKGLRIINIGGGLNINYTQHADETRPYRVEEEAVRHDLNRLMDDLRRSGADLPEERRQPRDLALDALCQYCQERIARSELDTRLKRTLDQVWPERKDIEEDYPALFAKKQEVPTPPEVIGSIAGLFESPRDDDVTVIVEPGRTIVGDAGALLTTVLGCKSSWTKRFLVVDGAMTDVVRPSLYGAYHHIQPAAPSSHAHARPESRPTDTDEPEAEEETGQGEGFSVVDVVGPVCESGDFLGKDRLLPPLSPGACVVVRDAGAYCASMASNYNVRMRPVEVMVDGSTWRVIRRPDTVADVMRPYQLDTATQ